MTADPFRALLGVPESADELDLLGLRAESYDVASIEAALRQRIGEVYRHPQGRTEQAERVRQRLREAAASLLATVKLAQKAATPAPRPHGPAPTAANVAQLTDFDRQVLAVLIGSGGWNAATRSRLVAVAAAYGVTVGGLLKVMTGLSEYAKRGGPRLEVTQIAAGRGRVTPTLPARAVDAEAERQLVARLAPELHEAGPASTIKLSLLFGLLTVLFVVIVARLLFTPDTVRPLPADELPAARTADAAPAAPLRPPVSAPVTPAPLQPARYPQPPTFQGLALTPESAAAADDCPQLIEAIAALARRLTVSDEPSEAVYRGWDATLDSVAIGWVLVDDKLLDDVRGAVFDALYAASDTPSVTDRLLETLVPPTGRLDEPVDLWRGAWMAGTLAQIAGAAGLPPAVVQRARIQLEIALDDPDPRAFADFASAGGAWLNHAMTDLVDVIEFSPSVYDEWEFWIAARRRLGRGRDHDAAVMNAIESILVTSTDLSRQGPSVNVLGRLLSLTDFETSRLVKDRFLALFADEQRVGARDLWVLTSLLALRGAPAWFSEDLVLPEDADWMYRRRVADRIGKRWPPEASSEPPPTARVRGLPVDPDLAARWLAMLARVDDEDAARTTEQRLDQLVAAAWLNDVALRLATADEETARKRLELIEAGVTPGDGSARLIDRLFDAPPTGPGAPRVRPLPAAGSLGTDGEWAVAYEQAGHSLDERMSLLQTLRDSAGTDLGPVDAETFVRIVYRGTHAELRSLAREMLVEQFSFGPTVSRQMLDQLPGAPANQGTSEAVSRFTGRLLPGIRSGAWGADARLALLDHTLELLRSPSLAIDERMEAVLAAYDSRRSRVEGQWSPSSAAASPHDAAEALGDAWRQRASAASTDRATAVPGDLAELQRRQATRRRLADGPLQRFVAAQLAILDLMAYLAAADQSALREPVQAVLADSSRRRAEMTRVLAQAVEAERAMGRLWRLQIAVDDSTERRP